MGPAQLYMTQCRLSREDHESMEDQHIIPNDYMLRKLAHQLILDLPLEKLEKLVNFKVTDPEAPECWEEYNNPETTQERRWQIITMKETRQIQYDASIKI